MLLLFLKATSHHKHLVFLRLGYFFPVPTTTMSHFIFSSLVTRKKGSKLHRTQKPQQEAWSSMLMEFTRRNPRLISYGLDTKHHYNQQGLQDTLWRERQCNHPGENHRGKEGSISNNYMKYLKTKVFYKLFLNTVHKISDIKQKPSKCGTWQKQVMEIKANPRINCLIYLPLFEIKAHKLHHKDQN